MKAWWKIADELVLKIAKYYPDHWFAYYVTSVSLRFINFTAEKGNDI